jgi:phosphatidylserine/phosphatidylglycerophosphate/cardiolipin synthase-like enzyme
MSDVSVLGGGEVALEVLNAIGYKVVLRVATIVSFNMQDYDFWGHGALSHLLLRQLSLGASIRLFTTPPPGRPTGAAFKNKHKLLADLEKNGVQVFLNHKLHAKAYLFLDTNDSTTAIVGSANLTGPGFGMHLTPEDNLLEMAMLCGDPGLFETANEFVERRILDDKRTEDFATWFSKNSVEIGKAGL